MNESRGTGRSSNFTDDRRGRMHEQGMQDRHRDDDDQRFGEDRAYDRQGRYVSGRQGDDRHRDEDRYSRGAEETTGGWYGGNRVSDPIGRAAMRNQGQAERWTGREDMHRGRDDGQYGGRDMHSHGYGGERYGSRSSSHGFGSERGGGLDRGEGNNSGPLDRGWGSENMNRGFAGFSEQTRPSHRGKGPKNFQRSDERLRELISEALSDDHDVDASEIEVEVKNGEVILKGTVEDRRTKRLAEDCVERISGIGDIQNQLRVGNQRQATSRGNQTQGAQVGMGATNGNGSKDTEQPKHRA